MADRCPDDLTYCAFEDDCFPPSDFTALGVHKHKKPKHLYTGDTVDGPNVRAPLDVGPNFKAEEVVA